MVSEEASSVSITIYRAPGRGDGAINVNWPQGYALITETRTVHLPAGDATVRFEGVSEGMFPESAMVTGLPQGVREKNRDARLLSPQGLVDAYLKREVSITRADKATGVSRTQDVFITAGPDGGVIFESDEGFEALRCTGLPERMTFSEIPAGLSAKPTLSILTTSPQAVTAKLTLTYLASGFDWQADYIATVKQREVQEKPKMDLFAWLTVANGGNQSFANANMMVVAGEPNRERRTDQVRPTGGALIIRCWPMQRTHQVPYNPGYISAPPPPPAYAPMMYEDEGAEIMVTATRRSEKMMDMASPVAVVVAEQEDLGDLKLYRVPERVMVNAKGQKQVAMIVKPDVTFERVYVANAGNYNESSAAISYVLRSKNDAENGLGVPLPAGRVAVFENSFAGPLLAGEGALPDRALNNEIEVEVGRSSDVRLSVVSTRQSRRKQSWRAVVTNARDHPVTFEMEIPHIISGLVRGVEVIDGVPTWRVTVPANDEAKLSYAIKLR
ncbi:hypothetical protein HUO14_11945 [Parasphingorhabdus flavimaris]|uniref:DUF4139 domain-containing protein n=1 Tax=Parasphingorhabdus flavimaris TaxID=266812 RepID=A0ABX2N4I7_9SPHN|nr:hypothetical protein [Parasphingorhabdus flavimaris]